MNINQFTYKTFFCIATSLMINHVGVSIAQDVSLPCGDLPKTSQNNSTNLYWATTGLFRSTVMVKLHRNIAATGIPHPQILGGGSPSFLMPTNWFPGPMELIDPGGEVVPPLKPEVNLPAAYPETLSWGQLQWEHDKGGGLAMGYLRGRSEERRVGKECRP